MERKVEALIFVWLIFLLHPLWLALGNMEGLLPFFSTIFFWVSFPFSKVFEFDLGFCLLC